MCLRVTKLKLNAMPHFTAAEMEKSRVQSTGVITHLQPLILLSRPTLPSLLPPPHINKTEKKNKHMRTCTPALPDAPPIRLLFLRNLGLE